MEHPKFHFFFYCGRLDVYHHVTNESIGVFMSYNFLLWARYGRLDIYHHATNEAIGVFLRYNFL